MEMVAASTIYVGLAVQGVRVAFIRGAQIGRSLYNLGMAVQNSVGQILARTATAGVKVKEQIVLVGQNGTRVIDFLAKAGQRIAYIEVKYKLPSKGGEQLERLSGQISTASTHAEALAKAGNNVRVVIYTFKEPTVREIELLTEKLGPEVGNVQLVHGFLGLVNWLKFFFKIPLE
jgi:predicted AAA+ superfamily ATPase